IIKRGQRKVFWQKQFLTALVFSANFILIFASWWWQKYYYIYLPFISLPLVLNCIMVFMIITYSIKNLVFKPEQIVPATPETMVLVMPCYNETFEECTRSLDSLISQVRIDQHKKAIMIICDGKVRGPGMEKTTAQYLIEDILMGHGTERRSIRAAYRAWDGQTMDIEYVKGIYKGVPFFCIIKQQNQGKRDSLIVSRSFVYNFNRRAERPKVVFAPVFFEAMANWLHNEAEFDMVDVIIGMDADTVFDRDCISHLVTESHYPNTVGVCGYVAVDFLYGNWNLWSIYQSAEYTISQALRRLHQSLVTHKVSCLPGCCQLLKVCEETCGDRVLIDLFGYHPKPLDGIIRRIRATASEDRNHVCLMLMESPRAQTRQALRARAYTDVPHGFRVFLSQRRRWTLGATSNDLMLFTKAHLWHFNWWERIVAFSNVITWLLNPFVIASLGCMIYAFIHIPWWIIVTFASIMIIPLLYYVTMIAWMPRNLLERCQFMLGLCIFTLCGPFINIGVTVYAIWNMDNFSWGKTRTVVAVTGEVEEASADE
ncbi:chitin synthase-domain-containing protein, partial [Truncatella angustata]